MLKIHCTAQDRCPESTGTTAGRRQVPATNAEEADRLSLLHQRNAELEALITNWENAGDPGSRWLLHLLRQALAIGRNRVRYLAGMHP